MGYRQLTQTQRYQIHARHDLNMSRRQIAEELGIHNSTVSRELRRNTTAEGYDPEQAQALSDQRRRSAWKRTKRLPSMIEAVVGRLQEEWSPEQISGFMKPLSGVGVSPQWIYSLIHDDKALGGTLWQHLRQPRRRSKQRANARRTGLGKIPHRVGIEHRPVEVDERLHIGHWEGDTILKGHKQSGLVTLVERRSGYLLAARLPKVTAELTQKAMIKLLKLLRGAVQTVTLDNGSEFAGHEAVAKAVTAAIYFCDPYCSKQVLHLLVEFRTSSRSIATTLLNNLAEQRLVYPISPVPLTSHSVLRKNLPRVGVVLLLLWWMPISVEWCNLSGKCVARVR